jgi:hypothetical protein
MTKQKQPHQGGSYVRGKDDDELRRAAYTRESHEATAEQPADSPPAPAAEADHPRATRGKR